MILVWWRTSRLPLRVALTRLRGPLKTGSTHAGALGAGWSTSRRRPRLDLIDAATRTGSHLTDHGELSVTGTFSAIRQRRLRMVVKRMFREHVRNGVPLRWLDIGCGHGELLLTLRGVLPAGSTIVGVEPNVHKIAGARARGAQVVAGLEDVDGEFDVLSLMNVYSHLPDPVLTISEITSRFLADNGELLVETGNAAEVPDRSHYPGRPSTCPIT